MKNKIGLYMLLCFVSVILNAAPVVDFDGKTTKTLGDNTNDTISLSNETKDLISPSQYNSAGLSSFTQKEVRGDNTVSMRLFEIKENGMVELVKPVLTPDGRAIYEFRPNTDTFWEVWCTGQNPNPVERAMVLPISSSNGRAYSHLNQSVFLFLFKSPKQYATSHRNISIEYTGSHFC